MAVGEEIRIDFHRRRRGSFVFQSPPVTFRVRQTCLHGVRKLVERRQVAARPLDKLRNRCDDNTRLNVHAWLRNKALSRIINRRVLEETTRSSFFVGFSTWMVN